MKLKLVVGAVVTLLVLQSSPVFAYEPCEVTFCLWGKLNGSSSQKCNNPINDFFNIIRKKKGSFLPNHTFDARKEFLNNECPSAYGVQEQMDKVMSKYGKVKKA